MGRLPASAHCSCMSGVMPSACGRDRTSMRWKRMMSPGARGCGNISLLRANTSTPIPSAQLPDWLSPGSVMVMFMTISAPTVQHVGIHGCGSGNWESHECAAEPPAGGGGLQPVPLVLAGCVHSSTIAQQFFRLSPFAGIWSITSRRAE